jgi:hypothetical protein
MRAVSQVVIALALLWLPVPAQGNALGRNAASAASASPAQRGRYSTIDDPKAAHGNQQGTFPSGVNDQGDIVGTYVDSSGNDPGFLRRQG